MNQVYGVEMESVVNLIEKTINKSVLTDFKMYLNDNKPHRKWLIYSDYCIGDDTKPNDVISFTLMPFDAYPDDIKQRIFKLAPTDIKNKKNINPDFISYLKEKRLFHINFILGSRKGITKVEGYDERKVVNETLDTTVKMFNQWCITTPKKADYYQTVIKKLNNIKTKLSGKSPNYSLFRDVVLVSILAGYICYLFTKYASAEIVGWFSDRDKLIEAYEMIASDLFFSNHHGLCIRDSIDSSMTRILFSIPTADDEGKVWYDEMNRLPDHIAGTLADWNMKENKLSKRKFVDIVEKCIADNPYLVILRLDLEPKQFKCSRVLVKKKCLVASWLRRNF